VSVGGDALGAYSPVEVSTGETGILIVIFILLEVARCNVLVGRIKHVLRKLTMANNAAVSAGVGEGIGIEDTPHGSKMKLRIVSMGTRSKHVGNTLPVLEDDHFDGRPGS